MHRTLYLKIVTGLSFGGTLFAGYLGGIKLFTKTCAFNEACPYFLGYPACWYGFGMYLAMFVVALAALMGKLRADAAKIEAAISFLGILFAGFYVLQEIQYWLAGGTTRYSLGLPTCAYGLIFYVAIFSLSLATLKKGATEVKK
ncbi:hypothetical protein HY633_01330 [Candidatus Uhrbacteria bacterium]|nr:hypothetical protein [Candidatus Uhrbacteria bacterium]